MISRRMFGLGLSASMVVEPALAALRPFSDVGRDRIATLLSGKTSPGGFVAVTRGDKLEAFVSWGHASISFGQPVTDNTLFHLGSVSKHVTALAVLRLQLAGKLDVDRPVGTYLKDAPRSWERVLVRQLLSHTSGLPDYLNVLKDWDRPQPREVVMNAIRELPLNFSPGDAWDYTNSGYLLLGWIIADVTGRKYSEHIADLFRDAGTPTARLDAAGDIIRERAEPYSWEDGKLVHATRMETGVSAAADGGILMSARDAAPWRSAIERGRLVPYEAFRTALSPAMLTSGRKAPYNYGFRLDRTHGQTWHHHDGSGPGFLAYWGALPDQSLSVLAMTSYDGPNGPNLGELAYTALEAVAPNSTYQSLPDLKPDSRARAVKVLLERGEQSPDGGVLAPELAVMGPRTRGVPRLRNGVTSVLPVESYEANGGEMVRYRIIHGGQVIYGLAGWTKAEKLFWLK
jgi:CubicO group peptidase (beta-lactamase class C family)